MLKYNIGMSELFYVLFNKQLDEWCLIQERVCLESKSLILL